MQKPARIAEISTKVTEGYFFTFVLQDGWAVLDWTERMVLTVLYFVEASLQPSY